MIELTHDRYLVTGGAGFIGSHICEELVKQKKQVICVDNLIAGKRENLDKWWNPLLCTFVKTDVINMLGMPELFDEVDIVFHNAASKCTVCRDDPHRDLMVNAWGSYCVFEAARRAKVKKIVHASTGSTMNGKPKSFYGVSKLTGESYLRAFREYYSKFRYSVLQYYHVYGPRQDNSKVGGVIPIFIRNIRNGEPVTIYGDGLQVRHFTNVKDIVNVNFLAANDSKTDGEFYQVVSDVKVNILQLAKMIYKLTGKEEDIQFEPTRLGDIRNFNITNEKLKDLGVEFQNDFEEGLRETIEWYGQQKIFKR